MKDFTAAKMNIQEEEDFILNDDSISEREDFAVVKDIVPHFKVKEKVPENSSINNKDSSINESNSFNNSPSKVQASKDHNIHQILSTKKDGLITDNYDENEPEENEREINQESNEHNVKPIEKNKMDNINEMNPNHSTSKKKDQSIEYKTNDLENIKDFQYAYKLLSQRLGGSTKITKVQEKSVPVEERLIKYKESIDIKTELQKKKLDSLELKECTFKPRVNSSEDKRTFDKFLETQHSFITRKNEKLSQKEQEIRSSVDLIYKFKPEINPNSVKINCIKQSYGFTLPPDPIYIKLFNLQYQRKQNCLVENEPIPKINKKSENLNRNCKIEERLYQDAMRRINSQSNNLSNTTNTFQFSKGLKTQNNFEFTNSRFKKEYEKILENLGLDQNILNFDQVKCILTVMGFIKYEANVPEILNTFWNLISGGMNITSKESLLNLLLIIMKILPDKSYKDNSKIIEFGNLTYQEIQEQFKSLFINKITFNNSQIVSQKTKPPKKLLKSSPKFKFQPKIEPHSKTLAKKYKDRLINAKEELHDSAHSPPLQTQSIEDLLIFSKKMNQDKINKIKKEIETKESSNCTFKPNLIPYTSTI